MAEKDERRHLWHTAPTCRGCVCPARRWPTPTPGSTRPSRASPRASAPCATGTRTPSPWRWRRRATASPGRTAAAWRRCRLHRRTPVRGPPELRHRAGGAESGAQRQRAGPHRLATGGDLGTGGGAADGARRGGAGAHGGVGEAAHQAASPLELQTGDGAAALLVGPELGNGPVVARLIAHASRTVDFVDHFRGEGFEFDYTWEERWIRDEGYNKIVPAVLVDLFKATGVEARRHRPFRHAVRAAARRRRYRQEGRHARRGGARQPACRLRRDRRGASAGHAGGCAGESQAWRQDPGGRLRPGLRRAAVRGDGEAVQAGAAARRQGPSGAAQGGGQLRQVPVLQRPRRHRARHARRHRQADGAVLALPQPAHADGLHRRRSAEVRHPAVPEGRTCA